MEKEGKIVLILFIVASALWWIGIGVGVISCFGSQTPTAPQRIDHIAPQSLIDGNCVVAVSSVYYPKVYTLGVIMAEKSERIIYCESTGVHDQWGDLDYKYPAYGIAQFQKRTFFWLAGLAGEELDWKNETDQRWLLNWAIDNNYGYLWSCYKIIQ